MSENYLILAEWPYATHPLKLGLMNLYHRSYIENFVWHPDQPTRFFLVHKTEGTVIGPIHAPSAFAFHHINAFEESEDTTGGGTTVHVDVICYDSPSIIDALYLNNVRHQRESIPPSRVLRYSLPVRANAGKDSQPAKVEPRVLFAHDFELPRFNYRRCSGRPYRFCYGLGGEGEGGEKIKEQLDGKDEVKLFTSIVKLQMDDGTASSWTEAGCYPSEPIFVASPSADSEDDGVVLSVVLRPADKSSFLLILNAKTMSELARARVSHLLPIGLHGLFQEAQQ